MVLPANDPSSTIEAAPAPAPGFFTRLRSDRRLLATVVVVLIFLIGLPFAFFWVVHRFTHSITVDAFVESHIVNLGPQVAGHIDRMLVEEHDLVKAGQLLCRIDPRPYQRQVDLSAAKLGVAEATLRMEETALQKLELEVPRRIAIAEKELAVAQADETKAEHQLQLAEQDVDKAIREAQATVAAAKAVLVNAEEDYKRYKKLVAEMSVSERKFEDATKVWKTAQADLNVAEAKLARAEANKLQIKIAAQVHMASGHTVQKSTEAVQLAKLGTIQIEEAKRQVGVKKALVEESKRALEVAQTNLNYTRLIAPFDGVVVKRYRHLGDFAPVGSPVLSIYNTEVLYVTANMEETRLEGIAPGSTVRLDVDAFGTPFHGRVAWLGRATAANFALVPRDVSAGEFTKVVQRVPIRILIDKDERWPQLRPGLSVTVTIDHGPGDPEWARQAAEKELRLEQQNAGPEESP